MVKTHFYRPFLSNNVFLRDMVRAMKKTTFSNDSFLSPSEVEFFSQGIEGVVTIPIALYQAGQIKISGQYWRAKLYDVNCQTTLLIGQPVLVIGREDIVLRVIPYHCLLWDLYDPEFLAILSDVEIGILRRYERCWRKI